VLWGEKNEGNHKDMRTNETTYMHAKVLTSNEMLYSHAFPPMVKKCFLSPPPLSGVAKKFFTAGLLYNILNDDTRCCDGHVLLFLVEHILRETIRTTHSFLIEIMIKLTNSPGPRTKAVEPAKLKSEMAVDVLSFTVVADAI
jgi:hypothetical protein